MSGSPSVIPLKSRHELEAEIQRAVEAERITYQIRPFEVTPGEADRVITEAMSYLADRAQNRDMFEIMKRSPAWLASRLDGTSRR